jgi:hypothetical protein
MNAPASAVPRNRLRRKLPDARVRVPLIKRYEMHWEVMMSAATEAFVDRLVLALPEFSARREEHLEDNFGKMLPHVLIGEIASDSVQRYEREGASAVEPLLDFLESALGEDPEVDELIGASFIEALPYPGQPGAGVTGLLGPKLTEMLRAQRA